jgi:hypothetical protein
MGRAGDFFERHGGIKAYCCCVAKLDDEHAHPAFSVYLVHDNEHHSGRQPDAALDQGLEHALNGLTDSFIPLTVMRDTKNNYLLVFVGIVAHDDAAKLKLFACGLSLNSSAGEIQGNEEWNAGLYESI